MLNGEKARQTFCVLLGFVVVINSITKGNLRKIFVWLIGYSLLLTEAKS